MQSLQKQLKYYRDQANVAWETIELDYVLSWVLEAISQHPVLAKNLAFKGGTALKKCWFNNYRYSQDLDFTEIEKSADDDLNTWIEEVFVIAANLLKDNMQENFSFVVEPLKLENPHPFSQAAYTVQTTMPWHRKPLTKIKLEISREEYLAFTPVHKKIIHAYDEKLHGSILCYSLEEIVAEKFRGILQNQKKYFSRGWTRPRVRDYYDLWRILNEYKDSINLSKIREIFPMKCASKDIEFKSPEQFFVEEFIDYVGRDWQKFLQDLAHNIPDFGQVLINLRRHAYEIF